MDNIVPPLFLLLHALVFAVVPRWSARASVAHARRRHQRHEAVRQLYERKAHDHGSGSGDKTTQLVV